MPFMCPLPGGPRTPSTRGINKRDSSPRNCRVSLCHPMCSVVDWVPIRLRREETRYSLLFVKGRSADALVYVRVCGTIASSVVVVPVTAFRSELIQPEGVIVTVANEEALFILGKLGAVVFQVDESMI